MEQRSPITSPANPLVKQIRSLRQHKGRQESGLFLVEGIHPVGEAVEADWEVDLVLYAPDLLQGDYALQLVRDLDQQGVRCQAASSDLFHRLAEKDNPQGLLAVVRQKNFSLDRVSDIQKGQKAFLGVAVVSPQDPGNLGTILRTMDAVGADALFLLEGGVDLYHPTVVRASMGTLFWKPVVQAPFREFTDWARGNAVFLIGTSAHAGNDYRRLSRDDRPRVLVLGNEQKGLSEQQLEACDTAVSLPMRGRASSLNLAVAAGVLLYHLCEER